MSSWKMEPGMIALMGLVLGSDVDMVLVVCAFVLMRRECGVCGMDRMVRVNEMVS